MRLLLIAHVAAASLAFATPALAQIVRGTVLDDTTHTPVPLAQITLLSDSNRVLTTRMADSLGEFELPVPRDDSVYLKVESVGFATLTTPRFAVGRGQLLTVQLRMSATAVMLEPMIVVARHAAPMRLQDFYRRADLARKLGQGRIWMREDLERAGTHNVRAFLASVIMRPAMGCRGGEVLLDDLPVDAHELDMIDAQELEGIEIYRDALEVPPEYAPRCNLVLLWRKPYDENLRPITWRRILVVAGVGVLLLLFVAK